MMKQEDRREMKPRLLLVGTDSTHTVNYYHLIKSYFSEISIITSRGAGRWGDVPVILTNMSFKHPWRILKTLILMYRSIRKVRPDIIHVHQAGTPSLYTLLTRPRRIPVVVTAWGSDIFLVPSMSWFHRALVKYVLRKADFLTADSRFMAEEMKRLVDPLPLRVLVANFGIPRMPEQKAKEKLIYSNRLHKKLYRIDQVLKAFHHFLTKEGNQDWQLVVAGQGEETVRLTQLAEELGIMSNTSFVGFVDQNVNLDYYARAAIFISVPESDATSISLLEALAAGCRPIVSDLPSNREWIEHGRNGIIVADGEVDFIAAALQLDYDKVLEINIELIRTQATRDINRKKFEWIYDTLLKKDD